MENSFFIISVLLLTVSCSRDIKTTYRIVGKDGKVMYIDARGPENIDKTRKSFQNPKKEQPNNILGIESINKKNIPTRQVKEIETPPITSSAYSLDSILDRNSVRYNYGMDNGSFEDIGTSTKRKSISDFDKMRLPYFSDVVPIENGGAKETAKMVNRTSVNKVTTTRKSKTNNITINNISNNGVEKARYYLQIGLFSDKKKALNLKNRLSKVYNFDIIEVENKKGEILYKVITKVLATEAEAEKISEKVKKTGHNDVFIFKK